MWTLETEEFTPKPREPKKVRERDVEAEHVARVKAAGGMSLKFTSPGRRSVPDRIDLLGVEGLREYLESRGIYLSLPTCEAALAQAVTFTELKAPGKKPTTAQLREHERLRVLGFTVNIVDTLKDSS